MNITLNSKMNYSFYLKSYNDAVSILYNTILENKTSRDDITIPLLFLIRHSLEMGYKGNINYLSKYSDIDNCVNYQKHNLLPLHNALKMHFENTSIKLSLDKERVNEFLRYYNEIEKLSGFFKSIDNDSTFFRYPVDKNGRMRSVSNENVDISSIVASYNRVIKFLMFLSDLLLSNIKTFEEENTSVLAGGLWNDAGQWDDNKKWNGGL